MAAIFRLGTKLGECGFGGGSLPFIICHLSLCLLLGFGPDSFALAGHSRSHSTGTRLRAFMIPGISSVRVVMSRSDPTIFEMTQCSRENQAAEPHASLKSSP